MSLFDPISELLGVTGEDPGKQYNLDAMNLFQGLDAPTAEELKVQLQQMVYRGDITPEQAQTILQNPSEMAGITTNPAGKSAQLKALAQLQGISDSGGMTPEDKAALGEFESRNNQQERGARGAIIQNAQERGVAGSGLDLTAELMNQQESAGRENQAGLDIAAQARQRALDAMTKGAEVGGQFETQQFGEEAQKAQAQDAINRFNAANSQEVVSANTAARNAAALRNATEHQRISDTNTTISNDQAKGDAQATQQAFENQATKASGVATQLGNLATGKRDAEAGKRAFEGQLIGTAGTVAGGSLAGKKPGVSSDERKKKDIGDIDLEGFLSSIDPKTFEYKDPNAPGASPGKNVGVMAQDLEKTPAGKTMVKDTSAGKMLDMQKGFGVILAALGKLHDEIDKIKEDPNHA